MPPPGSERIEEGQIEAWLKKNIPIRGHRLFQGSWQRETNGWCMNFFFQCFGGKYEDRRDWDAMDQWADEIVHELRVDSQNEGLLGQ
jgi:menaquinone-dependent protoporphyrinogen oxidase